MANELYMAGQPWTPTLTPTEKRRDVVDVPAHATLLTPQKANRKLDFTATPATSPPPSATSSPSSLPSPSTLLAPASRLDKEVPGTEPPRSPSETQRRPARNAGARRLVVVRESLEGAWKHVEPWEAATGSSTRRVFGSVEVLVLTGD